MAEHRTRKNRTREHKETPHYGFLVSWQPSGDRVKGESKISLDSKFGTNKHIKSADILAQDQSLGSIKKDIIKSLILVSLILTIELVLYLAWNKFLIK